MEIKALGFTPRFKKTDCFVMGAFEDKKMGAGTPSVLSSSDRQRVQQALQAKRYKGRWGEDTLLGVGSGGGSDLVFIVGLGKSSKCTHEHLRKSASRIYARAKAEKWSTLRIDYETFSLKEKGAYSAQSLSEGILLSSYSFDRYKSKERNGNEGPGRLKTVELVFKSGRPETTVRAAIAEAKTVADCVFLARDLGNEPPNVLFPSSFAERIRKMAVKAKVACRVFDERKLKTLKMGGIVAVGQGSDHKPRLVILTYRPPRAKNKDPFVFVGKGVTFDTGGISLKPGKDMDQMKFDMCGAAAVAAALVAVARLRLPLHVVGIIPLAENMPGGSAQRPGDIITCFNGKTVEVMNTDAEGRLILADALSYARTFRPKCVVDIATLTGLCAHFFDHLASGLMGSDPDLVRRLKEAGEKTGERLWELPLWDEYGEMVKGSYADVQNISKAAAGTITAGMFLKHFGGHSPWAHLDVGGTAWNTSPRSYNGVGATGVGVRLFLDFLKSYA